MEIILTFQMGTASVCILLRSAFEIHPKGLFLFPALCFHASSRAAFRIFCSFWDWGNGPSEYIQYWQNKESELNEKARSIDAKNMAPITNSLNRVIDIQRCFGTFYEVICDSNNPKLWDIKDRIIERIRTTANTSFAEELDNAQYAAEKEDQIRRLLD